MAPLAPSNTDRYFVDYEGLMGKRTFQVRGVSGGNQSTVVTAIVGFINAIKPMVFSTVTFNGLRFASIGSNVSNPLAWAPIVGTASGVHTPESWPKFVSFIGRSSSGRRTRIFIYGVNASISDDYRLNLAENTSVAAGVNFLNSASAQFVCIDGDTPVWKAYGNTGYNAYHQRKRRQVG